MAEGFVVLRTLHPVPNLPSGSIRAGRRSCASLAWSTVTFKVGEALLGAVAPGQEEKAQPAAGIDPQGTRLEHEERGFPSISNCDLQSRTNVNINLIRGGGLWVTSHG
ncbi:hypothetical protein Anapl_06768 [Anas platyrhynchos]|uniref:Uncharacterized protein n=1 Tax=Anas platyrhynchos TaxID=8839 RepID=R0JH63_ANAPL|nr:hypothetical protein Anapl_06768 [Anas platyrhynchos]